MTIRIIGVHPLQKDEAGRLQTRAGTVFPNDRVVVTLPVKSWSKSKFKASLNQTTSSRNCPPHFGHKSPI